MEILFVGVFLWNYIVYWGAFEFHTFLTIDLKLESCFFLIIFWVHENFFVEIALKKSCYGINLSQLYSGFMT